ncbi:hypothetical protein [Rubinisphaera margarita]|uniref:hypothetical protein n=1 Tax=Rubinisphaera margarita TaxID=2909586 RepID=UPI001EE83938|nr:hypothetical protein [Rubinisphaera margarita]MCG6157904.1 hypothetical protein [Rubinisphaera margarita]
MIRSTFLSLGMFIVLCGGMFLVTDRIVFDASYPQVSEIPVLKNFTSLNSDHQHELAPPDWVPFSLLAFGAVTVLYSIALPKKQV